MGRSPKGGRNAFSDRRFPGVQEIRTRLASGVLALYRYHRPTGTRLFSEPGTPAFAAEYARAEKLLPEANGRPVWVYFARAEIVGAIKIGKAVRPAQRIRELQIGSPDRLTLLGYIHDPSGGALECEVHEAFRHHRMHGEWFRPGADLLDFIAAHCVMHGRPLQPNMKKTPQA